MRLPRGIETKAECLFVACVTLWLAAACGGVAPVYPGPRRPAQEVVTLTSEASIRITGIDGRELSGRGFELLPGEHRVDFRIVFRGEEFSDTEVFQGMRRSCLADAKFIGEAGVAYRLVKISKRGGPAIRAIETLSFQHQFGVMLMDEAAGEAIPDAVSEMSCGM